MLRVGLGPREFREFWITLARLENEQNQGNFRAH
jgi:hypothetical protein